MGRNLGLNKTIDVRRSSQPETDADGDQRVFERSLIGMTGNHRYNPRRLDKSTDQNMYLDELAHTIDHH